MGRSPLDDAAKRCTGAPGWQVRPDAAVRRSRKIVIPPVLRCAGGVADAERTGPIPGTKKGLPKEASLVRAARAARCLCGLPDQTL
ncbi:hypothetical protein TUM18999_56840 [Pseudomonas tohonis]|uniref:Uncharacterized protein n=1 Tax=Pseudomonas tohonis TaxID=2725477 RepID=A0A6J4EC68_9PSED|nr:hypothetical protein TUM18999_56840 [Pseudomonas tohonis]GJN52998.1 hypothetical protein TUM20286_27500 [Pseudomonas tohonis]